MLEKISDTIKPKSQITRGDRLWCKLAGEKIYYTVIETYLCNAVLKPDGDLSRYRTIHTQTLRTASNRQFYRCKK